MANTSPVKYKPVASRLEFDSHAGTIVAGANCCVLEYTCHECDDSPYSSDYSPITGVLIVKAATVLQLHHTVLMFNQALHRSVSHFFRPVNKVVQDDRADLKTTPQFIYSMGN